MKDNAYMYAYRKVCIRMCNPSLHVSVSLNDDACKYAYVHVCTHMHIQAQIILAGIPHSLLRNNIYNAY